MNSVPSKLENNLDELYRKNQVKSVSFLVISSQKHQFLGCLKRCFAADDPAEPAGRVL